MINYEHLFECWCRFLQNWELIRIEAFYHMQKLYFKNRVLSFAVMIFMLIGMGMANQALAFDQSQHADSVFNSLPLEVRMLNKQLDVNLLFDASLKNTDDDNYFLPDTVEVLSVQHNPRRQVFIYDNLARNTVIQLWSLDNGNWFYYSFISNSYDNSGNLETKLTSVRQNGVWVSVSKEINTYEGNGLLKTNVKQLWTGSAWQNEVKTTNTWNSNGYLVAELKELWIDDSWSSDEFEIYVRNEDGSFLEYTKQSWDGTNWINEAHVINEFENGLVQNSVYQNGVNNEWVNAEKYTYSYNAQGQNTSYTIASWSNEQWEDIFRFTYTYNALGYRDSGLVEQRIDGNWQNEEYSFYTSNGFGSLLSSLTQVWENQIWLNQSLYTYDYDGNGNALEGNYYQWVSDSWSQIADNQMTFRYDNGVYQLKVNGYYAEASYFSMLVGNDEISTTGPSQIKIYPNPATSLLTIELDGEHALQAIQIFDLTGKLVRNIELSENVNNALKFTISLADVPNGLYFVEALGDKNLIVKKLTISK